MPEGIKVRINPREDIIEFLEGEFRGVQHFSYDAAVRETQKAGKIIADNNNWESIIKRLIPEIVFGSDLISTTTYIHQKLGINLSGFQYSAMNHVRGHGKVGYYWTSSPYPNSNFAHYIVISAKRVEKINTAERKNMFAVRCLKN